MIIEYFFKKISQKKTIESLTFQDFELIGYKCHDAIKMEMNV